MSPAPISHKRIADLEQSQLEPGPTSDLTPSRLAAFYRSVGGNDYIFRELTHAGLSLMYKTLGCFHALQPTKNPFEYPSVPCLLPPGFVQWQTKQLLLYPDEHAKCMQEAVRIYDVPKPGGGHFPKTIPRESFPAKPDAEMEKWHGVVLERLDEGQQRLKNSPYCSPYEVPTRGEGYFPHSSPHGRRTSRPARRESYGINHGLPASSRHRRSSVPSIPSPILPQEPVDAYHWASDHGYAYSAPNSAIPRSPRHRQAVPQASERPSSQSYHRASISHDTNVSNRTNHTSSKTFNLNFDKLNLPFSLSPFSSKKSRNRASISGAQSRTRPRSPRRSQTVSTGSEASSEDSLFGVSKHEEGRRRSSLAPPSEYNRYQRRHSHDDGLLPQQTYSPDFPPRTPQGPNDYSQKYQQPPGHSPFPHMFREDIFNSYNGQRISSAPGSPVGAQMNPKFRVIDPAGRDHSDERGRDRRHQQAGSLFERRAISAERRSRSGGRRGDEAIDPARPNMRREGRPMRVKTFSAAEAGKRLKSPEVRSAGLPPQQLRRVPAMTLSGGGRR